jgi:hypothetical protein
MNTWMTYPNLENIYKRAYKQFKAGDLKTEKIQEEKDRDGEIESSSK